MRGFLKENKEVFGRIDTELRKKLGIKASEEVEIPEVPVNGTAKAAEAVKSRRELELAVQLLSRELRRSACDDGAEIHWCGFIAGWIRKVK